MAKAEFITPIDALQAVQKPGFLVSRACASDFLEQSPEDQKEIAELEKEKIELIIKVLSHPGLKTLAEEGKITFGMIKPHIEDGNNLPSDQDDAAEIIASEIGDDHIIFNQPFFMTPDVVEAFYPHVKESLTSHGDTESWNNFETFMSTAPINLLLLYFPEGDAVTSWRNLMGPTMPDRARSEAPDSIRGRHATELPNNIVHGSDSSESVIKEIGIFVTAFTRLLPQNQ